MQGLNMYHLPHVCRTHVPEIHVHLEMIHVFQYISCLIVKTPEHEPERQGLELALSAMKIIDEYM